MVDLVIIILLLYHSHVIVYFKDYVVVIDLETTQI